MLEVSTIDSGSERVLKKDYFKHLVDTVGYSTQTSCLLKILLKPCIAFHSSVLYSTVHYGSFNLGSLGYYLDPSSTPFLCSVLPLREADKI